VQSRDGEHARADEIAKHAVDLDLAAGQVEEYGLVFSLLLGI
jgi:hypothetical protein